MNRISRNFQWIEIKCSNSFLWLDLRTNGLQTMQTAFIIHSPCFKKFRTGSRECFQDY